MNVLMSDPARYLDVFLLVFVRTISIFIATPVLSSRNIPAMAKVGFSIFLSLIVISIYPLELEVSSEDTVYFVVALIKEFLVGWIIGFASYLVFNIMSLAGQFIDSQIGFSMVSVFDPLSQIQFSVTGSLYYYLLVIMTLATHSHYYFIKALVLSFELIPLNGMVLTTELHYAMISFLNVFFAIAMQIAAPFFFVIIILDVVLGILARSEPQLNMFVIGFPIKIFMGLIVLLLTIGLFTFVSDRVLSELMKLLDKVIRGMIP